MPRGLFTGYDTDNVDCAEDGGSCFIVVSLYVVKPGNPSVNIRGLGGS